MILMQTSAGVSYSRVAEKIDFLILRVVVFLRTRKHLGSPKLIDRAVCSRRLDVPSAAVMSGLAITGRGRG